MAEGPRGSAGPIGVWRRAPRRCPLAVIALSALLFGGAGADDRQQPERLRDAVHAGREWTIDVPAIGPADDDFSAAIREGRALDSAAYLEIDRERRRIARRLEEAPEDPGALADRAALQERLRQRIAVNLRLGYLYAAGVYITLLETTGAPADEIRSHTERLGARRAFERAAERFEAALDDARLESPPGDNARFWLDRLRALDAGDRERLQDYRTSLQAALDARRDDDSAS